MTGGNALGVDELTKLVRDRYNAMTIEERVEYTKEAVKELQENREMVKYAQHNVPLAAWRDSQSTLSRIEDLVSPIDHHSWRHL